MVVTIEQGIVFAILAGAMILFVWNRVRYDVVAVAALLAAVAAGVIPTQDAFAGFAHPAVITVAAVLAISKAVQLSGAVEPLSRLLAIARSSATRQVGLLTTLVASCSALMNNVGALALLMPLAVRAARRARRSPSVVLMPLSFGSLLGGLITLIGTPPNIVIAIFRSDTVGEPFAMFDFAPVGLTVAVAGILFITFIGWRLLPKERGLNVSGRDRFRIDAYITEARIAEDSPLDGAEVHRIEQLCDNEITVMTIIRGKERLFAPRRTDRMYSGDILILEGSLEALEPLFVEHGLAHGSEEVAPSKLHSDNVRLIEAVVMPNSPLEGRSMRRLRMHENYGINLLAVARRAEAPKTRLQNVRFYPGDVLLLQGERPILRRVLSSLRCLPLGEPPSSSIANRKASVLPLGIFAASIVAAASGLMPVQIAFVAAVVALILTKSLPLHELYTSVEWPVIVLLGALIPIGEALQHTGATALIGDSIAALAQDLPTWGLLALLIAVSMLLSDLIHNTPTAVVMAPVGYSIAQSMGLSADAFLMAVAVGSASPYLTPIGHQSNTLVMGPGGYRFSDYWRLGLPLDFVIIAVAVPMIIWVWL